MENETLRIEDYRKKINIDIPQKNPIINNELLNKNKKVIKL